MSRRTTRSQTLYLEKAPVYTFPLYAKRKSTPAKKCGRPLTPITNLRSKCNSTTNDQSPEPIKGKNIQVALSVTPSLRKAATATPKITSNIALRRSTRIVRGTTGKKPDTPTTSRASQPSKVLRRRHTTNALQSTTDENVAIPQEQGKSAEVSSANSATKVLSISLTMSTPKRSQAAAKAKTFPEDKSAPEATISNVSSAIPDLTRRRQTIDSFRSEEAATTALNQDERKNADASITANDVPRRSIRITRGTMGKKAVTPMTSQPSKVLSRRHTANTLQSTTDENVATPQEQEKSAEVSSANSATKSDGIAAGVQESNVVRKRASKGSKTSAYASANIIGTPVSSLRIQSKEPAFIKITEDLRQILIDDSKFINTSKKLYEIPTSLNIAEVIKEYVTIAGNEESNSWNSSAMTTKLLFQGIIEYCDLLIGRQLLYEPERAQLELLLNNFPGVVMSKIYPPIYLLRLLVRLNKLMLYKNMTREALEFTVAHLDHFIKYLTDNKSTFF